MEPRWSRDRAEVELRGGPPRRASAPLHLCTTACLGYTSMTLLQDRRSPQSSPTPNGRTGTAGRAGAGGRGRATAAARARTGTPSSRATRTTGTGCLPSSTVTREAGCGARQAGLRGEHAPCRISAKAPCVWLSRLGGPRSLDSGSPMGSARGQQRRRLPTPRIFSRGCELPRCGSEKSFGLV